MTTKVPSTKYLNWKVKREGNGLAILWIPSGNGVQFKQSEERGLEARKAKAIKRPPKPSASATQHVYKQNSMKSVTE